MFADSLVTVSEAGRDLGRFTVTVEFGRRGQQACMLLHAQSQGAIQDSPCGTTVTGGVGGQHGAAPSPLVWPIAGLSASSCPLSILAYLTADLEVLEEEYHEYVKVSHCKLVVYSQASFVSLLDSH